MYNPAVKDRSAEISMIGAQHIAKAGANIAGQINDLTEARLDAKTETDEMRSGIEYLNSTGQGMSPEMMEKFEAGGMGVKRGIFTQHTVQAGLAAKETYYNRQQEAQRAGEVARGQIARDNIEFGQGLRDASQAQEDKTREQQEKAAVVFMAQQKYDEGILDDFTLRQIVQAPSAATGQQLYTDFFTPEITNENELTKQYVDGIGTAVLDSQGNIVGRDKMFNLDGDKKRSSGTSTGRMGEEKAKAKTEAEGKEGAEKKAKPTGPQFRVSPDGDMEGFLPGRTGTDIFTNEQMNSIGLGAPMTQEQLQQPGFVPPPGQKKVFNNLNPADLDAISGAGVPGHYQPAAPKQLSRFQQEQQKITQTRATRAAPTPSDLGTFPTPAAEQGIPAPPSFDPTNSQGLPAALPGPNQPTPDAALFQDQPQAAVKANPIPNSITSTLKTEKGHPMVDKQSFYPSMIGKLTDSPLIGFVPKDGPEFGIVNGTAEEYARFFTGLADMESSFQSDKDGDPERADIPGGSHGIFQLSKEDGKNHGITKELIPPEALEDPDYNTRLAIEIATRLMKRDGVISGKNGKKWLGIAAYWRPLRTRRNPSARFSTLGIEWDSKHSQEQAAKTGTPIAQPPANNSAAAPRNFFNRAK